MMGVDIRYCALLGVVYFHEFQQASIADQVCLSPKKRALSWLPEWKELFIDPRLVTVTI